jgi:GGDEF domain-containing protein
VPYGSFTDIQADHLSFNITVGFGVAFHNDNEDSERDLLSRANKAVSAAKAAGINFVSFA